LGPEFKAHAWVSSGVKEGWGKLGESMNIAVVLELGIRGGFIPVILVLIAEEAEVLLQLLVYVFGVVVELQVLDGGGVKIHAE
ncbi:hypothetical protein C0989_005416, partial [Termitomyces sp. Mn162]